MRAGWLFGITVKLKDEEFYFKRGSRKVYINMSDYRGARIERRFFRGWTLIVDTINKPIYFKLSKRNARKVKLWLDAQYTHRVSSR